MSSAKVGLGLGARGLKDKDWGPGVSDPYVVISRPSTTGGFQMLRTSEVKKNSLNPDWNDFLFSENELNGGDESLKLKIEVFDDDGKKGPDGKDKLLGTGYFSLKELEASATVHAPLQLGDGKKGKRAGDLVVRSVTRHAASGPAAGGAGAYPAPGGAYPAPGGAPSAGYPGAPGGGYPGAPGAGYPAPGPGYPTAGSGYPAYPLPSYPAQPGGYPPQPAYPPAPGGYPAASGPGGYPPSTGPYPPAPGPYPPAPGGYPPPPSGFAYPPQ